MGMSALGSRGSLRRLWIGASGPRRQFVALGDPPRGLAAPLLVLALFGGGSARDAHAGGASFVDVTASSGVVAIHAPSFALEFGPSILAAMCASGVTGDFDRDGDQDLFFVGGGANPDALFINNGDGTFVDQAAAWGVGSKHMGLAACVGDYDRDGWLDIYVTSGGPDGTQPTYGKHRLYRNTGQGSFVDVAVSAGVNKASPFTCDGMGCAFGDYDLDGDLDLCVAGWIGASKGTRLFRNEGNGTFIDVTVAAGIPLTGIRAFSPRFVDMDGDRRPELLIAADFGTSRYFRNNGDGTFADLTTVCGAGLDDNGMGHAVGDLDGNATLDWFVTSIFASGNPETPGTGNMLYRSIGPHLFGECSDASGVKDGNWGWGTAAVDVDHDGRLDLLATNGWSAYPEFVNQPARVWMNVGNDVDGAPQFVDVAPDCGLVHTGQGRGVLAADFDLDGDQDVAIFTNKGLARLFRNTLAGSNVAWLRVALDTSESPWLAPDGIGARVYVDDGARLQMRHIDAGTNYQSQSEMVAHFGLGSAKYVDVTVAWPDGSISLWRGVATNQHLTLSPTAIGDLNEDGTVDGADLGTLLGAWGRCPPPCPPDLDGDGNVDGADLGILLGAWG